ncbi:unnamed protein product, partial [Polarella glacialis]
ANLPAAASARRAKEALRPSSTEIAVEEEEEEKKPTKADDQKAAVPSPPPAAAPPPPDLRVDRSSEDKIKQLEAQLAEWQRNQEAADLKTHRRIVELLEQSADKQKLLDDAEK